MYLAWASMYEGGSDATYFDVLIPRVIEQILSLKGIRPVQIPAAPSVRVGVQNRSIDKVAEEICENKDAFHLLFIHADTDGRHRENGIKSRREAYIETANELCGWPSDRTIVLSPRHEMEAWAIADGDAVCRALGYKGKPIELQLPASPLAAERLGLRLI